jgi:hypothetical protein
MGGLGEDETIRGTADAVQTAAAGFGGFGENGKYLGGIFGTGAGQINARTYLHILTAIY